MGWAVLLVQFANAHITHRTSHERRHCSLAAVLSGLHFCHTLLVAANQELLPLSHAINVRFTIVLLYTSCHTPQLLGSPVCLSL